MIVSCVLFSAFFILNNAQPIDERAASEIIDEENKRELFFIYFLKKREKNLEATV